MSFIALGWLAFVIYLAAQSYLSFWPGYQRSIYYQLNLTGAILLTVSSVYIGSWQAVVTNLFWAIFSAIALSNWETPESLKPGLVKTLTPVLLLCLAGFVMLFIDISWTLIALGWAGAWLFCGGYFLFSIRRISRFDYLKISIIAYLLLLPIYSLQSNWPSFFLGVIWMLISAGGMLAVLRSNTKT